MNLMAPALLPNGNVLYSDLAGISCHLPTGAVAWTFSTATSGGGAVSGQPLVDANGDLYFGDSNGRVYSVSGVGALRWSMLLPNNATKIWASGVLAGDGTLFFATSSPAAVFALKAGPSASPSVGAAPSPSPSCSPANNGPSPSTTPSPSFGASPSTSASASPASSPIGLSSGALAAGAAGNGFGALATTAVAVAGVIVVALLICFCAALHVGGIMSVPCFLVCCPAGRRQSSISKKGSRSFEVVEVTTMAPPALPQRSQRAPPRA